MSLYTILAPHIDDEVIGCFSILKNDRVDRVFYFFEHDSVRRAEADTAARAFGFQAVFTSIKDFEANYLTTIAPDRTLLLPSRKDAHPDHQAVNRLRTHFEPSRLRFYSIDLGQSRTRRFLGDLAKDKRWYLNNLYPSQSALWESDAAYYLFEDIHEKDYLEVNRYEGLFVAGQYTSLESDISQKELSEALKLDSLEKFVNHIAAHSTTFRIECVGKVYQS